MTRAPAARARWAGGHAVMRMGMLCLVVALAAKTSLADDDRIEETVAPGVVRQDGQIIELLPNFDANLFEQVNGMVLRRPSPTGGGVTADESPSLERLQRQGRERLERVHRTCTLSAEQRTRLELAIESDARRIAEEIDAARARYAGVTVNFQQPEGQRMWQAFQQDIQRCRVELQRAFGAGSLFGAVLGETLDERQQADLDSETRSRRSFRWRAMVAPVLLKMDETVGLDSEQHALIERLLVAVEPRLAGDAPRGRRNAHAEQMLVYLQLSRVDAGAMRERLSARQWQVVSMMMNQGKAMKSWLDQQGLVEADR